MPPPTIAEIRYKQFAELGEAEVRERLRLGRYVGQKAIYASMWLEQFDAARRAEQVQVATAEATQQREIDRGIARDGVEAAKIAAHAARRANWIALGALGASLLALVVAGYAALREFPITRHDARPTQPKVAPAARGVRPSAAGGGPAQSRP